MGPEQPYLIAPPDNRADYAAWRDELKRWRAEIRQTLQYDGAAYRLPEFAWAANRYSCNKIMTWDETFLDHRTGRYRVEEYLHEGEKVFGGYDAIVLWQAYPRIGFDPRNQFDFYRDLPGGLDGVRDAVRRFHAKGVRVFIAYNPWDTGTRREGVSDAEALGSVVHATNVDGIFLDTLDKGNIEMRHAADRAHPGVAFESEGALPLESLSLNHLSWAQWFDYGVAPGLLRNRWVEQRHMMHVIRRWELDHTNEMHLAWMNGAGMLVWENVFGSWVGWSPENRAMLKSMLPLQRRFTRHFTEGEWTPLVDTLDSNVYASEWSLDEIRFWTIVNRSDKAVSGPLLEIHVGLDEQIYDAVAGRLLDQKSVTLAAKGIAAFVAVPRNSMTHEMHTFLTTERHSDGDRTSRLLHPMPASTAPATHRPATLDGFMAVPEGDHSIVTHYRVRECGERGYGHFANSIYPDLHQDVAETRSLHLKGFAVADREVSNREYLDFLKATGYKPRIGDKFLHHWVDGRPAAGTEDEAVVFVDSEDARAYAKWRGARLPTDAEWQVAMEQHNAPPREKAVWNWTDNEYNDGRTRYCFLKGGSSFKSVGSEWYADSGLHPANFSAKFLEVWPGIDRCETIGFRLAVDL